MDLKKYFQKIREVEATIAEPHLLVTSLETADGGKAGIITEVPRNLAAKMIAEGRAALTSASDRDRFLDRQKTEREAAIRAEAARRLQVTVIADSERSIGKK